MCHVSMIFDDTKLPAATGVPVTELWIRITEFFVFPLHPANDDHDVLFV